MANMSYCRFENTKHDLNDCINAIVDREKISDNEAHHAKWMMQNIVDFLNDECLLTEDNTFDEEAFDRIIKEMQQED